MDKAFNYKKINWILILLISLLIVSLAVKAQTKTVDIKSLRYDPKNLTIKQGMTVIWVNKDSSKTHQVYQTFNKFPRSPVLFPYDKYNYTFNELGTFEYRDAAKPSKMIGNIIVVSEEDYVEEVEVINATNQTINATNQTITVNQTQETKTTVNQTSKAVNKSEENKSTEPIILDIPKEESFNPWWLILIVVVVVVGIFFIAKQFIIIKPMEIKEKPKKVDKKPSATKETAPKKAKIVKIENNIAEIKCPNCNNISRTILTEDKQIDFICDNCGANISTKL